MRRRLARPSWCSYLVLFRHRLVVKLFVVPMQLSYKFLFLILTVSSIDAFLVQRRKVGWSRRFMADTENQDGEPRSTSDWFSSAMYLDQLPTVSGIMPISSSSNPYLNWLESPDASNVAPWGTTTYWSPSSEGEEIPEQTNEATSVEDPNPAGEQQNNVPPLESSVNGVAPSLTVGVQIPSMEVPGTQRVVVWNERSDSGQFGMYSRSDARATVASNQPKPEPIDPNNPDGTFVTQTFYLSDEVRNSEASSASTASTTDESTVANSTDSSMATSLPEVSSTPSLALDDPPFNVVTDKSPAAFYTPSTATAASSEVPLVGTPFKVAETSPVSFYAPFTATAVPASPEGGLSSSALPEPFFLDDEMPYDSENNATVFQESLTEDPTVKEPDSIDPTTQVVPLTEEDTSLPVETNWNRWDDYKISTRYEGREERTPPQPLDPNDVSGKSSVTQTFFLGDGMDSAFEEEPFEDASPVQLDSEVQPTTVAPSPLVEALIDQQRKTEPKPQTTNFAVLQDQKFMRLAIALASTESARSSFPGPAVGAVITRPDGTILGKGFSNYRRDALRSVMENAGLIISSSSADWNITWPADADIRRDIALSTLYVTLEPSAEAFGTSSPPVTKLIELAGISRVVIGTLNPIPELQNKGVLALGAAGIEVVTGSFLAEECNAVNQDYIQRANTKLQRMAWEHFYKFGRPLGFIDGSDSSERKRFATSHAVEDLIWADETFYSSIEIDSISDGTLPWYGLADAYIVSIEVDKSDRFANLEWLASYDVNLPAGMERIVVLDAVDLKNLPTMNGGPHFSPDVDFEAFWIGRNRKPTRIILRGGGKMKSQADAQVATAAAQDAVVAATQMASAMKSSSTADASDAFEAAIQRYKAAQSHAEQIFADFREAFEVRRKLESKGVVIDVVEGGVTVDILNVIAASTAYRSVVWRSTR